MHSSAEKLRLRVDGVRDITPYIRLYKLRSADGSELPLITAGAHLEIGVDIASGKQEVRNYFICSNPAQRDFYEIAVQHKAPDNFEPVSTLELNLGEELVCDLPANHFHLHADASPSILIADGIGIAPMLAIAHTLSLRGRRFSLHYSARNKTEMAFADELQNAFPRQVNFYYTAEKDMDIMHLLADAPGNSLFYVCGPQHLLDSVDDCARALAIPKDRIQHQVSASENLKKNKPVVLELAYSNRLIQVQPDQPLLAALRDAKIPVNFNCCIGDCGTCAVKILEGEADHRDHVLSESQKAEGFICVCVSRGNTEKLVLAL